uniref:Uncharacterized protein n=1 Tax=Romanomermis culicivorax TaxID=13658 RepID=A0A915HPY9_ROMCU
MVPYLTKYEDDINRRTKWWPSYPSVGFNERSQARQVLNEFVVDAFIQPRCLAKSASAVSLTFIRDAGDRTFQPLRRTTSYSDLSPSHALPYDSRVAPRIVNPNRSTRVNYNKW